MAEDFNCWDGHMQVHLHSLIDMAKVSVHRTQAEKACLESANTCITGYTAIAQSPLPSTE